ncbi:amino acid transporter [Frankia sp. AgB1.9]|uniref:LysE/ArgO family amino acid transporter n=1 Tax=unclassified Frankia TaxID=2632575 RepID=UPI00193362D0|nr:MULTISPECIES: LysE/ArgO family amino acid transporter [unclassified Frankia]MBL7490002.1 amino acid transporter [Frankia sp. AgW1.1]MBL7550591.1 amino acid transporter [Frankia sp. AgB1.9]MBL7619816.1 amino acid transporter [Frankia sp. AgB1.8]
MTAVLAAATTGLLTGFSLIVAIGAQNAYVLQQGLARHQVGTVVLICAGSDLALITAGVGGVAGLLARAAPLLVAVRWLGVAFMLWFAATSLRRAARPPANPAGGQQSPGPLGGPGSAGQDLAAGRTAVAARAAAFTWLNPHVYLDTVLILGTVGGRDGPTGRWWFAVGAGLASIVWFASLGYGARLASTVLAGPATWRVLDLAIGVTMLFVAARLAFG